MLFAAGLDRERSLKLMWNALRSSDSSAQWFGKIDPGIGHALLNARYYSPAQGQFLTEDPVFLGQPKSQNLQDPQSLNAYSYSEDNPIVKEDPLGRDAYGDFLYNNLVPSGDQDSLDEAALEIGLGSQTWNFAINHPYTTAAVTAIGSIPSMYASETAGAAIEMASWAGVGGTFAAQQSFAALVYSALAVQGELNISGLVSDLSKANTSNASSILPLAGSAALDFGPTMIGGSLGGYPGAILDAAGFTQLLNGAFQTAASNLFSNSVQTRQTAASTLYSGGGSSSSGSAGGTASPSSLWVTPSGAVVTFGGQLVSAPPAK